MHIHSQLNAVDAANFNGAAHNECAESNRRSAEIRRKLNQAALSASLDDDETLLVGHWLAPNPQDSLPGDEYRGSQDSHDKDLA
jgi:hypothetical protein